MSWLVAASQVTWPQVGVCGVIAAGIVGLYFVWAKYGGGIDERAEAEQRLRRREREQR